MRSFNPPPAAVQPAVKTDAAAVFQRCLDKPIQPKVVKQTIKGDSSYSDDTYNFSIELPKGFSLKGEKGIHRAIATSRSGLFTVIIKTPKKGGSLKKHDSRFLAKALKDPSLKVLKRVETKVGGTKAIRYYLSVKHRGKTYCASEVMTVHDGYTYRVSVLQRLMQGRCMGDTVVDKITSQWKWLTKTSSLPSQ